MTPEQLQSFLALGIGFAVAGVLGTGYQYWTERPASFRLISEAPHLVALAVPFVVFTAPFIIMRNTVRGRRIEGRRFEFVMLATIIAGLWSLMSGSLLMRLIEIVGLFA